VASCILYSMLSRPRPCSGEAKVPAEAMVGPARGHAVMQGVVRTAAGVASCRILSAFWTRGVPGPTSKIVAVCPCPDGLVRDGTQVGE
jgi:hypothetical protein